MEQMNWNEILTILIKTVLIPIIPLLVVWGKKLVQAKIDEIKTKTNDDTTKKYIDLATDVLLSCVECTTETFVKKLKDTNEFTEEKMKEAFILTKDVFLKSINDKTKEVLQVSFNDYNEWIKVMIERMLSDTKRNK